METKYKIYRRFSLVLLISIVTNVLNPTIAWALTAGPDSPEFSSFEPVATTDMVNTFSGDFTYNLPVLDIPGPDGAGYSLSLSYHSGTSSEEEASWVGYGWTLNPGGVNRNMRGFPDEFNGSQEVHQYNKTRPNWSASVSRSDNMEFVSVDKVPIDFPGSEMLNSINSYTNQITAVTGNLAFGSTRTLRFNNNQGFSRFRGTSLAVRGVTAGMNTSATGTTYSVSVNVVGIINNQLRKSKNNAQHPATMAARKVAQIKQGSRLQSYLKKKTYEKSVGSVNSSYGSTYGLYSYSEAVRTSTVSYYQGKSVNWSQGISLNPGPLPIGYQRERTGNFNMQWGKDNTLNAYGYMNNPTSGGENVISDYYVEKAQSYNKRDLYLGLPFNNADNYMVTGEGLSGGFRFYNDDVTQYYPAQIKSKTDIYQLSPELDLGLSLGVGVDFGLGFQKTQVKDWGAMGEDISDDYDENNHGGVFRFNNDMGGYIEYGNNNLVSADLMIASADPGAKSAYLLMNNNDVKSRYKNTGNSSYIQKRGAGDSLKGFNIYNQNGVCYEYGNPVYTRNDVNMYIDAQLQEKPADKYQLTKDFYLDNAFNVDKNQHEVVAGEIRKDQYATNFLMTKILSPDYVDVNNNNIADSADFGAWTSFGFHQAYGDSEWYRWRIPYTGMLYNEGEISSTTDNTAFVQTGEKEVYYLKVIETKSHIAYFVTNKTSTSRYNGYLLPSDTNYVHGSQNNRLDGMGAGKITGSKDPSANGTKGDQKLEYLEKIVIFSKARMDKPLKTVCFSYDYSLVQNLPNHVDGNYPLAKTTANSGKLTLKKVWFEYEGTFSSRISPYEFEYKYKDITEYPLEVLNRYGNSGVLASNLNYSDQAQNPDYNPKALDAWGNVTRYGNERQSDLNPWPYQGVYPATPVSGSALPPYWQSLIAQEQPQSYDPAAWQLKQIKLPSGGEILIEYEEDDYAYVQDRPAMAMAGLLGYDEVNPAHTEYKKSPEYYINLSDIGIKQSDPDFASKRNEVIQRIKAYYADSAKAEKVYFKFLYNLSVSGEVPDLNKCYSEYIDGYARFKSCTDTVYNGNECIKITLTGEGSANDNFSYVPRKGCYDFAATQRVGKDYDYNACISEYEARYDYMVSNAVNGDDRLLKFIITNQVLLELSSDLKDKSKYAIPGAFSVCTALNPALSYIKIPLLNAKRGGGIRVKRLLIYDPGMETGTAAIYGSEYIYKTENGMSSGVATTEPSSMREENPLVTFLPRKGQSAYSRLTTGQDKEQCEGFLGESILPAPSVGYSRVVIKNIHSGKTGTGFTVQEYYTAKDFPVDGIYRDGKGADHTLLSDNQLADPMILPLGLFNYSTNKLWLAQGYRFIQHNMHGQIKRIATYGGSYDNPQSCYLTSAQSYEYYEPGEPVKMIHRNGDGDYILTTSVPGKEMDVTMEMNAVHDNTIDVNLEVDITIGIPSLNISVGAFPTININEEILRTHTTTKILRYPAMVKKVVSFKDGATSTTEYLAYNKHTGEAVVTKTYDSYHDLKLQGQLHNGSTYSITIPASWYYPEMGQKAQDSNNTNQLSAQTGSMVSYGTIGNPLIIASGDSVLNWFADPQGVLSASVQTFSSNWTSSWNDSQIDDQYGSSPYTAELNTIYRPHRTYVFKGQASSANADTNKIYNSGIIKDFVMYWQDTLNPKWIKASEVTRYSPNGNAVEEIDAVGIYSSARFGYKNNALPLMVAANADYSSIAFEDYENNSSATSGIAHSGNRSLLCVSGQAIISSSLNTVNTLSQKGGLVKLWLKEDHANANPLQLRAAMGANTYYFDKVAQTGDWTLYSVFIPAMEFSSASYTVSLQYNTPSTGSVYIDDLRIQPLEASSKCYVYDIATLRLLAEFDDNHFGLYYQYNGEGKLVRKLVETEDGLKLVQENQYNMPKQNRIP